MLLLLLVVVLLSPGVGKHSTSVFVNEFDEHITQAKLIGARAQRRILAEVLLAE